MKLPAFFYTAKGCCLSLTSILTLVYFFLLSGTYGYSDTGMFNFIASLLGVSLLVMWASILASKK